MATKRLVTRLEQIRAWKLLLMEYTPAELAAEIGCDADRIYKVLIPAGCPHRRDQAGRIWIVGTEFAQWANRTLGRTGDKLPADTAYCLRCKKAVPLIVKQVLPLPRGVERMIGDCPTCGAQVNRMRAKGAA